MSFRALLAMAVAVVAALATAGPAGAATAPRIADVTDGTSNTLAVSESFMDYTDDSCIAFGPTGAKTPRGLATKSGGEVCSADSY